MKLPAYILVPGYTLTIIVIISFSLHGVVHSNAIDHGDVNVSSAAWPPSSESLNMTWESPTSVLSSYKIALARARCQARCNDQYGVQRQASPHEFEAIYRPFLCANDLQDCHQCSSQCSRALGEMTDCETTCTTEACTRSCSFLRQVVYEEASDPGLLLAQNLPAHSSNMTVTEPIPACLYTPPAKDLPSEGSTVVLRWNILGRNGFATSSPLAFVLELKERTELGMETDWEILGYTNFSITPITLLEPNSLFMFRVSAVSAGGLVAMPATSEWIRLPRADMPHPPQNVTVVQQYVRGHSLKAVVSWSMPSNIGCYFKLYWMTPKEGSFHSRELREWIGYRYELGNLAFDGDYRLEIQSYDRYFRIPSKKVTVEFRTLNCLESSNYNYESCAPDSPTNFKYKVMEPRTVNESVYSNVSLTWDPPRHVSWHNTIDKYIIAWRKNPDIRYLELIKPDRGVITINGDRSQYTIADVHWDSEYIVTIAAESKAGTGQKSVLKFVTGVGYSKLATAPVTEELVKGNSLGASDNIHYANIIPAVLGVIAISVCVFYYVKLKKRNICTMRTPMSKEENNPLYEYTMSQSAKEDEPLLGTSEYEVDYKCLKFTDTLGEGAFGKVLKAEFTPPGSGNTKSKMSVTKTVAVKILKEHATPEERRYLLLEIEAMKSLGHHPHVVSMLGCVSSINRPCLIMDYCPLGDLTNYLRQHRTQMCFSPSRSASLTSSATSTANINSTRDSSSASSSGINSISSKQQGYMMPSQPQSLSQTTLLSYARQIASGMEFLDQNRFIHRDLATRNILMFSHQLVKISDFGLSRDVYETNVYQPTSSRKLPYKWMPLESIFDNIFTIKSDVWSYGILLWEIVTLGACPYPGIPNTDLFRLLQEGYRLERPSNCSHDIYKIMLSCWHPEPTDRPSFTTLKKKMETLLEGTCSYIDLTVEVSTDYYANDSNGNTPGSNASQTKSLRSDSAGAKVVNLPHSNAIGNRDVNYSSTDGLGKPSKRFSHFSSLRARSHYPVTKSPYMVETKEPVPGLSEELFHKTVSSVERAKHHGNAEEKTRSVIHADNEGHQQDFSSENSREEVTADIAREAYRGDSSGDVFETDESDRSRNVLEINSATMIPEIDSATMIPGIDSAIIIPGIDSATNVITTDIDREGLRANNFKEILETEPSNDVTANRSKEISGTNKEPYSIDNTKDANSTACSNIFLATESPRKILRTRSLNEIECHSSSD